MSRKERESTLVQQLFVRCPSCDHKWSYKSFGEDRCTGYQGKANSAWRYFAACANCACYFDMALPRGR